MNTILHKEILGVRTYEVTQVMFNTSLGAFGIEKIYSINRHKVDQLKWNEALNGDRALARSNGDIG